MSTPKPSFKPSYDVIMEEHPTHHAVLVEDDNDWVIIEDVEETPQPPEEEAVLEWSVNDNESNEKSVVVAVVFVIVIGYALCRSYSAE